MDRIRESVFALTVVASAMSCAGPPIAKMPRHGVCDPNHLAPCERAMAALVLSGELVPRDRVVDWIEARRIRDPADAWVATWDRAAPGDNGPGDHILVVARSEAEIRGFRGVKIDGLRTPEGATSDAMMVALADAGALDALVHVDGAATTIAFGADPLAPFVAEGAATAHGKTAALDADLRLARAVKAALGAAKAGNYLLAQKMISGIGPWDIKKADEENLARLAAASATLADAGVITTGPRLPTPQKKGDPNQASPTCEIPKPPALDHVRALALLPRLVSSARSAGRGDLARAAAWSERFREAVATTKRAGVGWAYGALLVRFGGELGVGPESQAAIDASLLATEHARSLGPSGPSSPAIAALARASLFGRPELESAVKQAVSREAASGVETARDPFDTLVAAAGAIFGSAGYPPPLRASALDAVDAAVNKRLRGDLARATGWGVAALYAADAAARAAAGRKGDVAFSSEQIRRALAAEKIEDRPLASLASVASAYAALAAEGALEPESRDPKRMPPRRAEARAALRIAIQALGETGEAPNNVVDDVTELTDGLFAALASATARAAKAPAPRDRGACVDPTKQGDLDARTRRAFARLGDVRQRILVHPRFRQGHGNWVKRTRLLVLLLSDAMDVALRNSATGAARHASGLTIESSLAHGIVSEALDAPETAKYADAAADALMIAREVLVDRERDKAPHPSARDAANALREIALVVAERTSGKARANALAVLKNGLGAASPGALIEQLYAVLSATGTDDEADLALLAALVVEAVSDAAPSAALVDAALAHRSRVAWALALVAEIDRARDGGAPDPDRFAAALDKAATSVCSSGHGADVVIEVTRALADASAGRTHDAAARLDRQLDLVEREGLALPRVAFRYEARGERAVGGLTIEVSSGFGLLRGSTEFQLDAGLTTAERAASAMTAALGDAHGERARDEAGRYYVAMATLAGAYHFAASEEANGARDGARAIGAVMHGVRLGDESLIAPAGLAWADDARGALLVLGELASEHEMPLLAGDLFTVATRSLPRDASSNRLETTLTLAPLGLAHATFSPMLARTRKTVSALDHALPCGKKGDAPGFDEVSCGDYAKAVALREADALKHLPRLERKSKGGATCEAFRALDGFLAAADQKTYEADRLAGAARAFVKAERPYEAAVLLARYKRRGQCSGPIVGLDRTLGRSVALDPDLRADVLSDAVNCSVGVAATAVDDDLAELDRVTERVADASRNLHLVLSVADRAGAGDAFGLLSKLAAEPSFVDRWIGRNQTAATAALLVRHAIAKIDPRAEPVELGAGDRFLCDGAPAERLELCRAIGRLTDPKADAQAAREALRAVVATANKR